MIKSHPTSGCELLRPKRLPVDIIFTILQHHERINGSGYPFGLSGEDILLEARILGVADVMEAMFSHRPYRHSLGIKRALGEICQNRGILYDPLVVDALVRINATTIWGTFFFRVWVMKPLSFGELLKLRGKLETVVCIEVLVDQ